MNVYRVKRVRVNGHYKWEVQATVIGLGKWIPYEDLPYFDKKEDAEAAKERLEREKA